MKKLILFIFSLFHIVYSQYGANLIGNGNFDTGVTGWSGSPTISWYNSDVDNIGRTNCLKQKFDNAGVNKQITYNINDITLPSGTVLQWKSMYYVPSSNDTTAKVKYSWYDGSQHYTYTYPSEVYDEWVTFLQYSTKGANDWLYIYLYKYDKNDANINGKDEVIYHDNISLRERVDTLYISTTGNNNDSGNRLSPVQTLAEAFEIRGSHSGGYFIVNSGTYSESITIDSSFAKLEASGTAIITAIDFNNISCTVDLANLTINTKTNDNNVIYLNDSSANNVNGYNGYNKYSGYKK